MFFNHPNNLVKCRLVAGLLLGAGFMAAGVEAAEIRYVTDRLTLNMYKDTSLSQRLPPLKTGDKVEIISIGDGYTKVKTSKGVAGWVKSSYLDKEIPAGFRLPALQEELDALRSKHTDLLINQDEQPQTTDKELQARVAAAEASQQKIKLRVAELEQERNRHIGEIRELRKNIPEEDDSRLLLLWIILPLLTLITGFFIGLKYLDTKIRSRFGGFNPL